VAERCAHTFEEAQAVFTGTVRTRACCRCDHVEVLSAALVPQWLHLDEYLQRAKDRCESADQRGAGEQRAVDE
jgi:hypothetical protein